MDDAYKPLSGILKELLAFSGGFTDEDAGVHTYIRSCEIETPIELDISRESDGTLSVGTTPPLYPLMTTIAPVYHRLRFVSRITEGEDDG
jgi:hypothetical protein